MKFASFSRRRPGGRRQLLSITIAVLTISLLTACGDGKSRQTVTTFLDRSLPTADYDIQSFGKTDSTERVTPAYVRQMRSLARSRFKAGTAYVAPTAKLRYVRVVYIVYEDTIRQTFYMDDRQTGVVCVKDDNP